MYVCLCKGLRESDVHHVARAGAVTADALIAALGLEDPECCGRCALDIDDLLPLVAQVTGRALERQPAEHL